MYHTNRRNRTKVLTTVWNFWSSNCALHGQFSRVSPHHWVHFLENCAIKPHGKIRASYFWLMRGCVAWLATHRFLQWQTVKVLLTYNWSHQIWHGDKAPQKIVCSHFFDFLHGNPPPALNYGWLHILTLTDANQECNLPPISCKKWESFSPISYK